MIYTEEQWDTIKKASPHYESAKHEYIRNAPRWLTQQVIDVYEAATGKTVMHKDLSCAVCVLNIYKQIAKTYFQDKLERENFADLENHQSNNLQDKLEREKQTMSSKMTMFDKKNQTKTKNEKADKTNIRKPNTRNRKKDNRDS